MLWQHYGGLCPKVFKQKCIVIVNMSMSILDGDKYTKIGIGVIIQILEGLHALCYRFGIILSNPSPSPNPPFPKIPKSLN